MSMTLVEIKKSVTDPLRSGVIETLFTEEPVLQFVPFQTIAGLAYSYNTEQALPGIAFRKLNGSYPETTGVIQRQTEPLKPFGGDSDTDRAFIEAYGAAKRAQYDRMFVKAMGVDIVQRIFYGNSPASRAGTAYDDVDGIDGIQARLVDPGAQVIEGGGSSGSDGSSVFAIRFGDGFTTGLQTGSGVAVMDLGQLQSKPAFRTRVEHIAGFAIEHGQSVGWIKDLTAATTMLTTVLMDQLVDAISGDPTIIVMSKRSRRQLKADALTKGVMLMSTLDALGRPVLAWDQIPILVSDAIIDTETVS